MRGATAVVLLLLSMTLGGCSMLFPRDDRNGQQEQPANSLSDDQSEAQGIDAGRQLREVARLQGVSGGISFESCNDQGEPPYRPFVEMSSVLPPGVDADTYARQVAAAMVAAGWSDGPPPGLKPFGTVIHRDGVMVEMAAANVAGRLGIQIRGECRNMTDHRNDGKAVGRVISDELNR